MKRMMPMLRVLLAIFVNLLLQLAIALPIGKYIAAPGPDTPVYAWVMALSLYPIFVVQAVLMFRWIDRRPLSDMRLGFDSKARQASLWGCFLALAMLLAYVGLTQLTGVTTWHWNPATHGPTVVLMVILFLLAGPGEEFIFRGYIMNTLDTYGPAVAAFVSTLIFALIHIVGGRTSPLELLAIFLHGYFYAVLTQRSRSIWPAVIIHGVYDALTVLIWTGNPAYSLLAFDGALGWTKLVYKSVMVIPFMLMLWAIYKKSPMPARSDRRVPSTAG